MSSHIGSDRVTWSGLCSVEKIKVLLDAITAIYQQFKKDKAERRESGSLFLSGFKSTSTSSGRRTSLSLIPEKQVCLILILRTASVFSGLPYNEEQIHKFDK